MRSSKNIIIYHNHCGDGFGAAWAAWRKFGRRARYIGAHHGDPLPNGIRGAVVYICDFSYPKEIMRHILKKAERVIVLDHHVSARSSAKMANEYVYDLRHSGSVIAWRYFHPKKAVPAILHYIEDIDLWKFALPKTREIA